MGDTLYYQMGNNTRVNLETDTGMGKEEWITRTASSMLDNGLMAAAMEKVCSFVMLKGLMMGITVKTLKKVMAQCNTRAVMFTLEIGRKIFTMGMVHSLVLLVVCFHMKDNGIVARNMEKE